MLRLAIVGVGGYGIFHLQSFAALQEAGLVEVVGLADPSEGALAKARRLLPHVRCHSEYEALLNAEPFDAVVLATPIPLHEEMTLEAIRRGLHVLLEKPAVPLFSQWRSLLQADAKEHVAVAFQRISSPGLRLVKRLLDDGELGELQSLSVSAVWPRTSKYYQRAAWAGQLAWKGRPVLDGPATNGLSHFLNDIMFLCGPRDGSFALPTEIQAEVYRARQIPGYDTAFLRGRVAGGARFAAGFSHAGVPRKNPRLRVQTSRGVLWVEQEGGLTSEDFALPAPPRSDGRDEMWRAFVEFASGRRPRPDVLLRDVEGYTLATNLMLQSAGGIRTIRSGYLHAEVQEDGQEMIAIEDIGGILQRAVDRECTLFEAGAPWARIGPKLRAEEFCQSEMLAGLAAGELSVTSEALEPA